MKKIVTALANTALNDELTRYSEYEVLTEDIYYQDALIEFIDENKADVVIVSGLLQGGYNVVELISEIKKRLFSARVILIVDEIKEEDKNQIISKGVFDILKDDEIEIEDVIEAINREEPINIKAQIEREANDIKKMIDESSSKEDKSNITDISSIVTKVQKQEVITIFGTNGSGKSIIAGRLANVLASKTSSKILLIDLDTLNGNLDEILGVSKIPENINLLIDEDKKCGLNYAQDLISKNRFDSNVLEELVIKTNGFDFLSGNTSVHYCQNVLDCNTYSELLKSAKEKYDFIIIDTSSNIFLDATKWALKEATKVLFVSENSNICLKKTIQNLDFIFNVWGVYKGKVKLILNKVSSKGIDEDIFSEVCKLKLIGTIKQNMEENDDSYKKILEHLNYIPKKSFISKVILNNKFLSSIHF